MVRCSAVLMWQLRVKAERYDVLLFVCLSLRLFVRLSPKTRTCRVLADWPSSAGGRASRERPVRCWASQPVHDGGGQGLSRRPLRPN